VLVAGPLLIAVPLHIQLKANWGHSFLFLIPIVALVLMPRLVVSLRSAASSALIAAAWLVIMLVFAPIYPWVNFWLRPNSGSYIPTSEMAEAVTGLWRHRYDRPLPIVVSYFDLAAPVVFYSPDHPRMYADFNPAYSPWIDYPAELHRLGFVGVCRDNDTVCDDAIAKIAPSAARVKLAVARKFGGMTGKAMIFDIRIAAPGS
jgi:hypothetical protein